MYRGAFWLVDCMKASFVTIYTKIKSLEFKPGECRIYSTHKQYKHDHGGAEKFKTDKEKVSVGNSIFVSWFDCYIT